MALAQEAGALAMRDWQAGRPALNHWEKEPGQPVSAADLAVDALLRERLSALLPQAGWLSEETADTTDRLAHDLVWVVDPIDGTRDFVRGRAGWAVSIALVERGEPVLGVLCAPVRQELWAAALGQGATKNGNPLVASTRTSFAGARVPADHLPKVDHDLSLVAKPNSIALRIAMVAADEADLLASVRWGAEWDVAAAALIAGEAGATATDALGAPLAFNRPDPLMLGVLVCAPLIHAPALARLRERAEAAQAQRA
jgi:myo-inositol-1(or 4)-monophosphatase